jgi:Rrf2 family protein
VQISAGSDYAVRALCALAAAPEDTSLTSADIAAQQGIPQAFLEQILPGLRRAGLVESRRGPSGGHRLARPAWAITVADVVRVMDGPLALVRGERPEALTYSGAAEHVRDVWVAVRASLRLVLDQTTVEQLVQGRLPEVVESFRRDPRAWQSVWPREP